MLAPSVAAAAAPTVVCTVQDERLPKISGVAAVNGGYVVVDKEENGAALRLYKLDAACKPTRILNDTAIDPFSPQDLAITPDGAMWIADVGDDQLERSTAAVHKIAPGGTSAARFRLQYPDGKHNSAALIMQANGVPVIITKEAGTVAKLYTTAAPLTNPGTVPLVAAGTLAMPASTTSGGPVGPGGRTVVTGATLSPDGKKVLVRTFTDAYEYDVTADVPAALKGKPRHTPLPDEQQGEAITYTSDGLNYVTLSARTPSQLLEWTPSAPPAPSTGPKAGGKKADTGGGFSFSDLSLQQLGGVVLGVGAVGLILLGIGIFGIVRFRRQNAGDDEADVKPGGPRPGGAPATAGGEDGPGETVLFPRTTPSVYGSGAASASSAAEPAPAGVGAGGKPSGTVYGGGSGSGDRASGRRAATVYGGAPSEPPAEAAPPAPDGRPAEPVPSARGGTVYGGGGGAGGGTTYGSGAAGGREPAPAEPRAGAPADPRAGQARPVRAAAQPPPPVGRPVSGPPPARAAAPPPPARAAVPPPAQEPPRPPARPSSQGRPAGGTVYGGGGGGSAPPPPPPPPPDRGAERPPPRQEQQPEPPREQRDWRSRKPRD